MAKEGGLLGLTRKNAFTRLSFKFINLRVRILPGVRAVFVIFGAGIHVDHLESEAVHVRDFDVGREGRHAERDGIAPVQQAVLH